MLRVLGLVLVVFIAGCDAEEEPPVFLADRLVGTWGVMTVKDDNLLVTSQFEETVGRVTLELERLAVGAQSAGYRITMERPKGSVTQEGGPYSPNEPNEFILFNSLEHPVSIAFRFVLGQGDEELTLTWLPTSESIEEAVAELALLGIDYPFRNGIVFEFDRLG